MACHPSHRPKSQELFYIRQQTRDSGAAHSHLLSSARNSPRAIFWGFCFAGAAASKQLASNDPNLLPSSRRAVVTARAAGARATAGGHKPMIAVQHDSREDGARELDGRRKAEETKRSRCGILSDVTVVIVLNSSLQSDAVCGGCRRGKSRLLLLAVVKDKF